MENKYAYEMLARLVAIQSVSTDPERKKHILEAADLIKKELVSIGFEVELHSVPDSHPLIVAKKIVSSSAPTLGIYAHYDVQPEDPIDKWSSPPFSVTKRGDKLYGRGVADDKMHVVQSITAARGLMKSQSLKNNLIFIFEGEEECESDHFEQIIRSAGDEINTDAFYVLDAGMKAKNVPQIFYGLRGILTYELEIKIGETDLHSGVYGNRVANPAQIASQLFAKIKDEKGKVQIPGFYDSVRDIPDSEIELLSRYKTSPDQEKKNAKVISLVGDFLQSKIKPSMDINGISSGFTGTGFKTIIPSSAKVKFSFRLVENQDHDNVNRMVEKFIKDNLPDSVSYTLKSHGGAGPFYTDFNNPYAMKTAKILEEVFGHECYFNRSGGSIPAAEVLQRLFGKPIIITGFTLPDENIHAPDENVDADMFEKGIVALQKIFSVSP
ncbi:MAG: M20/M25/M40 family metallo-hydrolase [Patescibacteria group bacterium]